MKKTILQKRFEKAANLGPVDVVAREMGISPALFLKIKNRGHVPTHHRTMKAIQRYFEEKKI